MATLFDFEDGSVPEAITWPSGSGLKPPFASTAKARNGDYSLQGSDEALDGASSGHDLQWNFILELPDNVLEVSAWCWYEWLDDYAGFLESWSPDFQLEYSTGSNFWQTQAWICPIDRPGPGYPVPKMYIFGWDDIDVLAETPIGMSGTWYKFVLRRSSATADAPWDAIVYDYVGGEILRVNNIASRYYWATDPVLFRLRCEISTRFFWDDIRFINQSPVYGRLRVMVDPGASELTERWKFFSPISGENGGVGQGKILVAEDTWVESS